MIGGRASAGLAAALVVLLAACSSGGGTTKLSTRPLGEAQVDHPTRFLLPSTTPRSLRVSEAKREDVAPTGVGLHLYRSEERWLLVAFQVGSDVGPSLPTGPGTSPNGVRWLGWEIPSDWPEQPQVALVGTGFTSADLEQLRSHVVASEDDATARLDQIPDGFRDVASGRAPLAALAWAESPFPGPRVRWDAVNGQGHVLLSAVVHDDAYFELLRAAVNDPDGTSIRGHDGAVGPAVVQIPDYRVATNWVWQENGLDVVVQSAGVLRADVEQLIRSLKPATDAAWKRLGAQGSDPPSGPAMPGGKALSGSLNDGWWRVSWKLSGTGHDEMVELHTLAGTPNGGGGGPLDNDRPFAGTTDGRDGSLVYGTAPVEAAAVEIDLSDGSKMRLTPKRLDPAWPFVVWAQWHPGLAGINEIRILRADGSLGWRHVADRPPTPREGQALEFAVEPA
jgi:hypothetical protein